MEGVDQLLSKLRELLQGGLEQLSGEEKFYVLSQLQSFINQLRLKLEAATAVTSAEVQKLLFIGCNSIQSEEESEMEEEENNLFFYLDEKNQALPLNELPVSQNKGPSIQDPVTDMRVGVVNDILPRRVDNSEGGDNEDVEERVEPDIEEQAESWRGQDAWHEEGQAEEFNIAAAAILNSQDSNLPYQCSLCWKNYKSLSGIRYHVMSQHLDASQDECIQCREEGCTYSTTNKTLFRVHSASHVKNVPITCPVCKKDYLGGPKALKQHMKLHGSKRQYKCNYCIKDFISLSRLNHHVQNVHAEPKFHCEQCPKMFRSKVNFNRHMLVHTNEKPFVCPHCLFSCNNSANLNSHVRSVHKEKEFTTGSKEKAAKRAMFTKNVMKNKKVQYSDMDAMSRSLGEDILREMEERGEIKSIFPSKTVLKAAHDIQTAQHMTNSKQTRVSSCLKPGRRDQTITVRNSEGLLVKAVVKLKKETQNGDQVLHVCVKK